MLGRIDGGLRVRLVRNGADRSRPFVVLHEGRFSRIYLAEVGTADGAVLTQFAWKVRSDASPARVASHGRALTNRDVDNIWQREELDLRRVQSPHVVARAAVPEALLASRPIIYCQKTEHYFHPVSAESGLPLSVCRDEALLADSGLLSYAQSAWRYLHDGVAGVAAPTFYRIGGKNGERPRPRVRVRIGSQLFADWSGLVHAAAGDEAAARAAPWLPCLGCEHRHACYPHEADDEAIPAERELLAVSFYDVSSVALELYDFDYDEACELLGGGELADVLSARHPPANRRWLEQRTTALAGQGQWLFGGDSARFPVEVLRQKLAAFLEVGEGLAALHATGRPHLAVAPANIMARLGGGGRGAPVRWGLHLALHDLGSPVVVPMSPSATGGPGEAETSRLEPGPEIREDLRMRPFLSPFLTGHDGSQAVMTVRCKLTVDTGGRERLVVEAEGAGASHHLRIGDFVSVQPNGSAVAERPILWAQIFETKVGGLVAAVPIGPDHPCRGWSDGGFEAQLTFFRNLGPPVDLYGLGMLLFRTVLQNDERSMDDVAEAVGKCIRRLEDDQPGQVFDEQPTVTKLLQLLRGKDVQAFFEPANVLQCRAARAAYDLSVVDGTPAIDPDTWRSLLMVAFKLVTQWPGFSYSHGYAEASPFLLRQVRADLEVLVRRLHVDLFVAEARDVAIAEAGSEMLEQLRAEMMSAASLLTPTNVATAGAVPRGFRLSVHREGDQGPPQEYEFDREQVGIGRREVENLVRLSDPMVSAMHALIELQPEGHVIIDRGSTNGTEVDGIRLPVEVAQPLEDGSLILIRPFQLTFRTGQLRNRVPSGASACSAEQLCDQLRAEFARCHQLPVPQQHEALRGVLRKARETLGATALHARLEEILRHLRRGAATAASESSEQQAKFFMSAHRSLSQLSRTLLGPGEFETVEDVRAFAGKLARFVETTTQWIERSLDLRRVLGKHLELGATSTGGARAPVRNAADVRQLVLGWGANSPASEPTTYFLAKFYDDFAAIVEGLLVGAQQVRRAVREKLDPARLAEAAGREAKFGLLVNAAASSSLWRLYTQTFHEVTGGQEFEVELDRILQKSLQDYRANGRS